MDELTLKQYELLSPFEIKDFLAKAALKTSSASALRTLMPVAAIRTGSRLSHAKRFSLWAISRLARASA